MVSNTLISSIMTNNLSLHARHHQLATLCFIIIMLLGASHTASAQKYMVYSVVGKAYIQQGNRFVPLPAHKYINKSARLKITSESAVTILDEAKLKMYSFTREGTNTIADLLDLSSKRTKSLTKQYMSYIMKHIFDPKVQKMTHPDAYMQVTGTSYRAESIDSMFMARVVDILSEGTMPGGTPEQKIVNPANRFISDYDVSLELIDTQTGKPLHNDIAPNTACYIRVKNNTEETLYVNVLNVDTKGNKYLVLPMDEEATCSNLLVPAKCTVGFKTEPFITSDVPSTDSFLLVATDEPVNFSILMNDITAGQYKDSKLRVGISRVNTSIK